MIERVENLRPTAGGAFEGTPVSDSIPYPIEPARELTALAILDRAVERGADVAALERIMAMAERVEERQAANAFAQAMAACQAEMPAIIRDRENTHTRSWYATYENLNAITKPVYTKHGFSLSFGESPQEKEGVVRLYCDVKHSGGHSERYQGDFPRDGTGIKGNANMTALQGTGSTYSYAKRYLQKNIWNLAEADEDNDGNSSAIISGEQLAELFDLIAELDKVSGPLDMRRFCAWLQVEKLEVLPLTQFGLALDELKRRIKKGGAK